MKKMIMIFLLMLSSFILSCDPIDDAVGDKSVLPYGIKSECPVCPDCPIPPICGEYPKVTILEMTCSTTCSTLESLVGCVTPCTPECDVVCKDFKVYKIEMTKYSDPIFLCSKPVFEWIGGTTVYTGRLGKAVSQLMVGQRYKYWPISEKITEYCLFEINTDGNSLIEWNWGD
jgi:hypothetical protein